MDPITVLIVGGLLAAVLVAVWPWVVDLFTKNLIPWVKRLSPVVGGAVETLIVWADKGVAPVRGTIRGCFAKFKQTFLGTTAEYQKVSATTATRTVTAHVLNDKGTVSRQVTTEEVPYDEIPQQIREEMLRQQKQEATLDVNAALLKKFKERAQEQGVVLEEVLTQ